MVSESATPGEVAARIGSTTFMETDQMRYDPNAKDLGHALADYLCIRSGIPVTDPDPTAKRIASSWSLSEVLSAIAGTVDDPRQLTRVMTHSDVFSSVTNAARIVAGVRYSEQRREIAPIISDVPVAHFRSDATLPAADVLDIGEVPRNGPIPMGLASISEATITAPAHYGARILISRETVQNDDAGAIPHVMRSLSSAVVRTEAKLAAAALEAGSFTATTATGMDATSVGEALAALRNAASPLGNVANLSGQFLLVPPTLEVPALVVNESIGRRLTVIPLAGLTNSFLLASPDSAPVLARPVRVNSNGAPLVSSTAPVEYSQDYSEMRSFDGIAMFFDCWLGISVIDTIGCVEIPAS